MEENEFVENIDYWLVSVFIGEDIDVGSYRGEQVETMEKLGL